MPMHILDVPMPPATRTLSVTPAEIDCIDVADPTVHDDGHEHIDIGGHILNGTYIRVGADDLVAVADALHRLAWRIEEAVLDARQARIDAQRHACAFCPTMLEPDEGDLCGAASCVRLAAAEAHADRFGGL